MLVTPGCRLRGSERSSRPRKSAGTSSFRGASPGGRPLRAVRGIARPALAGRPGRTRKLFSTLLGQRDENFGFEPIFRGILRRVEVAFDAEIVANFQLRFF